MVTEGGLTARLPQELATVPDLFMAYRELRAAVEAADQVNLTTGRPLLTQVDMSASLAEFFRVNELDIGDGRHRAVALAALEDLRNSATTISVSFASQPSLGAVRVISKWFRDNVSPTAVLQVGVSPSIVAGCIVRTQNRVFNFTLNKQFEDAKPALAEKIRAL